MPGVSDRTDDDILGDPNWFPENLDAQSGEIGFVATDRATLTAQDALDHRWDRTGLAHRRVRIDAILERLDLSAPPPRVNFIWHTGFCGSTLVARTLDREGINASLLEPEILETLASAERSDLPAGERIAAETPRVVFRLLGRPFTPDKSVTLGPAPAANGLIGDAAALTDATMLWLYSDCRSFVRAVAKSGVEGRRAVRRLYMQIAGGDANPGPFADPVALTDLQIAALLWHRHIAEFRHNWPATKDRAASLDCDALLADPPGTLEKLDAFFGLGLGRDHLRTVANGLPFAQRARDLEIAAQPDKDIDEVVAWSYHVCPTTTRGVPLPNPLTPIDKAYHP